jgi:hypothetical protein
MADQYLSAYEGGLNMLKYCYWRTAHEELLATVLSFNHTSSKLEFSLPDPDDEGEAE